MSISTYNELKTAIANWLKRNDMTAHIPDFITLAETRINRNPSTRAQETDAAITMTVGQAYDSLPSGFLRVVDFWYNTDHQELKEVGIADLPKWSDTTQAQPLRYAISDKIYYSHPPDDTYAATFKYIKKWDIATDSTNWLLTNHPGVYLYGSLMEASHFLKNDARIPLWKQLFEEAMGEVNWISSKTNATLRVEAGLLNSSRYNIYTDEH